MPRSAYFLALFVALTAPALAAQSITQAELVRRTQEMYDAVAAGDHKPWDKYLADDVLYFDEKGNSFTKTTFLADLTPLPAGYSGEIQVANVRSLILPTVAILSFDEIETETVFGAVLHARYHETDTWLLRNGEWKIAGGQVLRYYEDPAAGDVDVTRLKDYVGEYEMAPGQRVTVTAKDGKLFAQRSGGKISEMKPESPDMFFRAGVEGRRLFHRDASGKVDSMIDRRNNEDLIYKRVS